MDIIRQLPFPDEICSKILLYAFSSVHTDLQEEILKRALPTDIYQKLMAGGGIIKDSRRHITNVSVYDDDVEQLLDDTERQSLHFDIQFLPTNLTKLDLYDTIAFGNIQDLSTNLTEIDLSSTVVTGDIQFLQDLPNLTWFDFYKTGVFGDIHVLRGLQHLVKFDLCKTGVTGDIQVIQELPNLIEFELSDTDVTGDFRFACLPNLILVSIGNNGVRGIPRNVVSYSRS
jgi:hypothetical protein